MSVLRVVFQCERESLADKFAERGGLLGAAVAGVGEAEARDGVEAASANGEAQSQTAVGQLLTPLVGVERLPLAHPARLVRVEDDSDAGRAPAAHHVEAAALVLV